MKFIISFIEKTMPKIIHHRNQLQHFRMSMGKFRNIFKTVMINIAKDEYDLCCFVIKIIK